MVRRGGQRQSAWHDLVGEVPVPPGLMEGGRPAGPRAGIPPTTSSSTGLRTRGSVPPAALAAGCLMLPPGAGRRTAGWRVRSPFPCPGWACGSSQLPRRPGHNLTLFSAAAACSGGRLEVLDGIFSPGRADCLAGWGGGMPRYFRRGGAVASRGFRCFQMVSGACFPGLPEGLVFPAAGVFSPMLPGASGRPSRPAFRAALTGAFLPFLPGVFRSVGERRRPRARRKITGPQKTGLCKKNARGSPATGCRVSRRGSVQ